MNSINIQPDAEPVIQRRTISEWQKILRTWKHQYHLTILKIVHHETTTEDEATIYLLREEKEQSSIENNIKGSSDNQGFPGPHMDDPF